MDNLLNDWKCPDCWSRDIEEVESDVSIGWRMAAVYKTHGRRDSPIYSGGRVVCYQCYGCGLVIAEDWKGLVKKLSERKEGLSHENIYHPKRKPLR